MYRIGGENLPITYCFPTPYGLISQTMPIFLINESVYPISVSASLEGTLLDSYKETVAIPAENNRSFVILRFQNSPDLDISSIAHVTYSDPNRVDQKGPSTAISEKWIENASPSPVHYTINNIYVAPAFTTIPIYFNNAIVREPSGELVSFDNLRPRDRIRVNYEGKAIYFPQI